MSARSGSGVVGHVPPAPDARRALLGVERAAVEVAAARRRLARAVDVATAAGAPAEAITERAERAEGELPAWMPPGGGPPSFAP